RSHLVRGSWDGPNIEYLAHDFRCVRFWLMNFKPAAMGPATIFAKWLRKIETERIMQSFERCASKRQVCICQHPSQFAVNDENVSIRLPERLRILGLKRCHALRTFSDQVVCGLARFLENLLGG